MSILKHPCSCKRKQVPTELRYLENAYESLKFCSEFSKVVDNFPNSESLKEQLITLYETNIEVLEDYELHTKLKTFLTETEKAKIDEILARPRPTLEEF